MTTVMTPATVSDVTTIPRLGHDEAMILADTEFARVIDLLRQLRADEWQRQTICESWDVRAMVAHMVGMAEAQASIRQFLHDFRVASKRNDGLMIDAMTATQVRDRAGMTSDELVERLVRVAPRAVRARRRTPAVLRWGVRMKQDPPFDTQRWKYGYLVDTIFTRDPWIHRLDISRATDREMVVSSEHDGRLVADVVAEWARRHGKPFTLTLTGPAGGRWQSGHGDEDIELDALEFCWIVAGRGPGSGLLTTRIPF